MKFKFPKLSRINEFDNNKQKAEYVITHIKDNAGVYSLLFSICTLLGSQLIKYIIYIYYCGYLNFFGISKTIIDISSDNLIFDLLFYSTIFIFVMILNLIPYLITKKYKHPIIITLLINVIIGIFFTSVIIFIDFFLNDATYTLTLYAQYTCIFIVMITILLSPGLIFGNIEKNKKQSNSTIKITKKYLTQTLIVTLVMLFFISCYTYYVGNTIANNKQEFTIVEEDAKMYAVLYETKNTFVISECTLKKDKNGNKQIEIMNPSKKREISRDNVTYITNYKKYSQ